MATLGVLICEILELEFAHLLGNDQDIDAIWAIEDVHATRFLEALTGLKANRMHKITGIDQFTPESSSKLAVVTRVLELGLHNQKKTLQEALKSAALALAPKVDALMLGYGLCGNALADVQTLLAETGVPIFIPMDQDQPVDDCIGLLIGGRKAYYDQQMKCAGTYYMIPGWSIHWRRMFEAEYGKISIDLAKRLFKNYKRSLLVPNRVMDEADMKKSAAPFSELFNLRTESYPGTLNILERTWQKAKSFVLSQTPKHIIDKKT